MCIRDRHKKMKEKLKKEYEKRLKLILKSELKCKFKVEAVRTLAVPVLSYGFGIIDWFQEDLNKLDIKTRKMLHAHKLIYKNQCLARMYVPRDQGGMGLQEIDAVYREEVIGLTTYIEESDSKFIRWVKEHETGKAMRTSLTAKKRDYLRKYDCLLYTSDAAD